MTVLNRPTALYGFCIVCVCNDLSRNSTNRCNLQTSLQRGTIRGAINVFSLVAFWILTCLSESWSLSSAVWVQRLEHTRDLCTCCAVVQRRRSEKIEYGFEVRICRAAIKGMLRVCNKSWAVSSPFSSLFLLCVLCIYDTRQSIQRTWYIIYLQ